MQAPAALASESRGPPARASGLTGSLRMVEPKWQSAMSPSRLLQRTESSHDAYGRT